MSSSVNPRAYPNYVVSTRTPRMLKVYLGDSVAVPFIYDPTSHDRLVNPNLGDGLLVAIKPLSGAQAAVAVTAEHSTYRPVVHFDEIGLWKLCLTFSPQESEDSSQTITIVQEVRVVSIE